MLLLPRTLFSPKRRKAAADESAMHRRTGAPINRILLGVASTRTLRLRRTVGEVLGGRIHL
jgi:hypothetical protein